MNIYRNLPWLFLAVVVGIPLVPVPADAQIGIRDRARQQMEQRAQQRADQAVASALDAMENAIVCVVTDQACIQAAQEEGHEVALTDEQGAPVAREDYPSELLLPGEGVWVNYDFVPGERVIFAEDFSRDRVGDFPQRLEFARGNMEAAEWQGQRWLRATSYSDVIINLQEELPRRFTLELDFVTGGSIYFADSPAQHIDFRENRTDVWNLGAGSFAGASLERNPTGPPTLRIMADGNHVKVYLNDTRLVNVPNADLGRSDRIRVTLRGISQGPSMLTNLRIASGPAADARRAARVAGVVRRRLSRALLTAAGQELPFRGVQSR